ncbi:MAG: hypothetical protein ACI9WU_004432, partial [Myxococcota bacterium]
QEAPLSYSESEPTPKLTYSVYIMKALLFCALVSIVKGVNVNTD